MRELASFFLSIIEPDRGESSLLKVKLSKRRERTGFLTDVRWGRHALSLGPHAQTGNAVGILCSENIHVCADRKHLKMFLASFRKILLPQQMVPLACKRGTFLGTFFLRGPLVYAGDKGGREGREGRFGNIIMVGRDIVL